MRPSRWGRSITAASRAAKAAIAPLIASAVEKPCTNASWWRASNARIPGLRYELTALTANDDRVFIEYIRHAPAEGPMPVAEVFDIRGGKIVASRVYHG